MRRTAAAWLIAVAVLAPGREARGAEYWAYAYNDFEVVAEGSQADAAAVARRLGALDGGLRKLLRLQGSAAEPPTRVYVLPGAALAALDPVWSAQGGAFFRAGPFDDFTVLASDREVPAATQEIYATRSLALLASWGLARLPDWYRTGVAQLAAGAAFDAEQLTIGLDFADHADRIARGWISMEKILRLPASDPEFHKNPETQALYQAQCWWLVHLMLLDGALDPSMSRYVERLLAGEKQQLAFVNSFTVSYELLDDYFRKLRRSVKPRLYTTGFSAASGSTPPRPLDANTFKASMAQLALVHDPKSAPGLQLANDVLAVEPDNERALLALARYDLGARRFTEVAAIVPRLLALENLSAAGHREVAELLVTLAKLTEDGLPGTQDMDVRADRAAARANFRRALDMDPADLQSAYQLGWLLATQGDVVGVRGLLPAVEAAFYRRPDSAELAALLVRMHSIAGNTAEVFKYSVAEQRLATTEAERAHAAARVERLRPLFKLPQ